VSQIPTPPESANWEPTRRLDRDLKAAARLLGQTEVRHLTDRYYQIQEFRKISGNQVRAAAEEPEPNRVLAWVFEENARLEDNIKRALDVFTSEYRVGLWMKSLVGIGPVISAGLLAHLDIRKAPTVGHWWRFAGYDPTRIWLGRARAEAIANRVVPARGNASRADLVAVAWEANAQSPYLAPYERAGEGWPQEEPPLGWTAAEIVRKLRGKDGEPLPPNRKNVAAVLAKCPWNADLKCLCWKLGDCFVKFHNHKDDYYGRIYLSRKAYEEPRNEAGAYREQAERALAEKNYKAGTEARKWYEQGKLPPARIHMRALRYASKMFLSHLHHVMYVDYFEADPPAPFGLEHAPGDHRHFVAVPNWPFDGQGKSLRELYAQP
jgi:hypothetical protein